jgi:hypothetical protein
MRTAVNVSPGRLTARRVRLCVSRTVATDRMSTARDLHQIRLARVVDAVRRMAAVDLLSTSLNPATGAIRVELEAPSLSDTDRSSVLAGLQLHAGQDADGEVMQVEFVDAELRRS